jgi:hypothetical protein
MARIQRYAIAKKKKQKHWHEKSDGDGGRVAPDLDELLANQTAQALELHDALRVWLSCA